MDKRKINTYIKSEKWIIEVKIKVNLTVQQGRFQLLKRSVAKSNLPETYFFWLPLVGWEGI